MNVTLYGLKNCDTCRKALREIEGDGHNVTLIDVREDGMDPGLLAGLLAKHGDEVLLNQKSKTWRELPEDDKSQKVYTLLSKHPSLMKRPVLVIDEGVSFVGWSEETRARLNTAKPNADHWMSKKAYWISIYNEVVEPDKLNAYAALAGPALTAAGGRILARGMPAILYEHGQMQRTVLIEFDSVEAANAAYKSAGYAEALAALDGGVVREVRIIEAAD